MELNCGYQIEDNGRASSVGRVGTDGEFLHSFIRRKLREDNTWKTQAQMGDKIKIYVKYTVYEFMDSIHVAQCSAQ
jgi:hypothetical protein